MKPYMLEKNNAIQGGFMDIKVNEIEMLIILQGLEALHDQAKEYNKNKQ